MKTSEFSALQLWRNAMHRVVFKRIKHTHIRRATLVGVTSALLAACNGGPGNGSSSSQDAASSSMPPSSIASSSAPASSSISVSSTSSSAPMLSAQMMFAENCAGCHGDFTDGVTDGNPAIDVNNFGYDNKPDLDYPETEAGLVAYLNDEMIANFCTGDAICDGDVIAAWLWSMRTGGNEIEATAFSDFVSDPSDQSVLDQGKMLYEQTCLGSGCHDSQVTGIGWAKYKAPSDFHLVIEPTMPKAPSRNPAECVGECSALISAYLWSVRPIEAACTDEDGILFAKRSLPLLTPSEYKNSIRDLFAFISPQAMVPEDYLTAPDAIYVGSFPHTLGAQVSEGGSGKRLFDNAVAIADWNALPANQFVSCSVANAQQCADEFINGFAEMAFRRPLKTEPEAGANLSEVAYFQRIFTEAPSIAAGIKWAIVGALNAPQFIYRDELGIPVSEAIGNPMFSALGGGNGDGQPGAASADDYQAAGDPVTVSGVDFSTKQASGGGGVGETSPDGNTVFKLYTIGSIAETFAFDGPTLLTISARGNDHDNVWPMMEVRVNGNLIAAETVATPGYANDYQNYTYAVTGINGNAEVSITMANDSGISGAMGAPMTDIDLHVAYASVTPAELKAGNVVEDAQLALAEQLEMLENDAGAYVLTPYQYASVLSYMITGSTPDPDLMAAAASGALNSRAGVEREIERLFATARAERHMKDFVANWMQTQELFKNTPLAELDPNVDLRELMLTELQEFFWYIVNNEDVPFSDFYNADYTFLNQRLAEHYGIAWNGGNGNQLVKTALGSGKRGGITTMGAFLAGHAHGDGSAPILRGVHVREDLLCHHIVPPGEIDEPEGLREDKQNAADEAAANGTLTTRRYFEIATSSPPEAPLTSCGQCHYYDINPVGATMADYDGFGRYRTQQIPEGGDLGDLLIDIDAFTGSSFNDPSEGLRGIENFQDYDEVTAPINGARELALTLGQTQAVQSCMVEKAFRSVLSRPITTAAIDLINRDTDSALSDYEGVSFACAKETLESEFQASGQSVKTLFKELGRLSLLRFRRQ